MNHADTKRFNKTKTQIRVLTKAIAELDQYHPIRKKWKGIRKQQMNRQNNFLKKHPEFEWRKG